MTANTMREAFEKWYLMQRVSHASHLKQDSNGCYFGAHTETAWKAWQATHSIPAAELERLRKDAERYRWLRSSSIGPHTLFQTCLVDLECGLQTMKCELDLDEAIDAAMQERQP